MEWKAAAPDTGKRLSVFLQEKMKGEHSLKQIKRWLENNCCMVNGQAERFASRRLEAGDKVRFQVKEQAEVPKYETLYEDEHYIIINKPAGLLTEKLKPILVHRLDKDTSGAIILAKTEKAREAMEQLFREKKVEKKYLALVDGVPSHPDGVVKGKIGVKKEQFGTKIWGIVPHGKEAETAWRLERKGKNCSLLSCYPKTGRTHQIRLHMNDIGHPILGDYAYCRSFKCSYRPTRQMLHAASLNFVHPFTSDQIKIEAPLPPDFEEALKLCIG